MSLPQTPIRSAFRQFCYPHDVEIPVENLGMIALDLSTSRKGGSMYVWIARIRLVPSGRGLFAAVLGSANTSSSWGFNTPCGCGQAMASQGRAGGGNDLSRPGQPLWKTCGYCELQARGALSAVCAWFPRAGVDLRTVESITVLTAAKSGEEEEPTCRGGREALASCQTS